MLRALRSWHVGVVTPKKKETQLRCQIKHFQSKYPARSQKQGLGSFDWSTRWSFFSFKSLAELRENSFIFANHGAPRPSRQPSLSQLQRRSAQWLMCLFAGAADRSAVFMKSLSIVITAVIWFHAVRWRTSYQHPIRWPRHISVN